MNCKSSVKSGTAVGIAVGIAVGVAVTTLTHVSHNCISTATREAVAATKIYRQHLDEHSNQRDTCVNHNQPATSEVRP